MRRKHLTHCARTMAEMGLRSRLWPYLETLADLPGGQLEVNILEGRVAHNVAGPQPPRMATAIHIWLKQQCPTTLYQKITKAKLTIDYRTDRIPTDKRSILCFDFAARCELEVDGRVYIGQSTNRAVWYHRREETMTPPLILRYATVEDNVLLAEIGAETFRDTFADQNTPENMAAYLAESFGPQKQAAELAEPGSVFIIAERGGEVVGFVRLHEGVRSVGVTGDKPIELVRIYARKPFIGQGIGPTLMQASLEEAAKRGCDVIWLGVWEHNPRGIAFYRKWGFEQVGTQSFKLGDDVQHDYVMQKRLALI